MTGCQLRRLIHPWVSLTIIILRGDHDEKTFYISFLCIYFFIRKNLSIRYAQFDLKKIIIIYVHLATLGTQDTIPVLFESYTFLVLCKLCMFDIVDMCSLNKPI